MAKMLMTDLAVRALKPPEKGQSTYWDQTLSGFGLRISQGGSKTWILIDPRSKVRTQETIGRYPIVDVKTARGEAKRRLAEYTLGKQRATAMAWSTALEQYLKEVERNRKERTHADYKRLLEGHFKFGATKLSELTSDQIEKKLEKLAGTPAEHQHAFVVLRAFINWAHRKHYLDQSPMARMQPPHKYVSRARVLTSDELKKVWLTAGTDTFGSIVKLLILTGQRRGEIANLAETMVQPDTITLPEWLTKNSREHVFPIGPMTKDILAAQDTRGDLYFPARDRDTVFNGFSKCKKALDKRSGVTGWTLHDLRRTFATELGGLGVPIHVVERLINHVSGSFAGIVCVYNLHTYMREMRDAVEKWETYLRTLLEIG